MELVSWLTHNDTHGYPLTTIILPIFVSRLSRVQPVEGDTRRRWLMNGGARLFTRLADTHRCAVYRRGSARRGLAGFCCFSFEFMGLLGGEWLQ